MTNKYLILDRDDTLGYFRGWKEGNIKLNPEIRPFLQRARADGFTTIMTTCGSERAIAQITEIRRSKLPRTPSVVLRFSH